MCCELHAAPMLFAQGTMLCILARLLGDGFVNRHHFALARVTGVCLPLLSRLFLLCWKGLLILLEVIKQVTDTLGYYVCLDLYWACQVPGHI